MSKRHYTSRRSSPGTAFALDVSPAQSIAQGVAAPAFAVVPADEAAGVARSSGEAGVQLDAEKLTVYHVALEFHELACGLIPAVHRIVKDQLERASLSVVLNLAEAMGSHYAPVATDRWKRCSCAAQVAEATLIRRPRRRPLVTWM